MKQKSVIGHGLRALVLAGALAGCGAGGPPYSEYFVVTFVPDTPTAAQEGVDALAHAVGDARHSRPREITIVGAAPAGGAPSALADQRAKAIEAEFTRAGIKDETIHIELRPAVEQDYGARKDSFIVTLAYGSEFPKP